MGSRSLNLSDSLRVIRGSSDNASTSQNVKIIGSNRPGSARSGDHKFGILLLTEAQFSRFFFKPISPVLTHNIRGRVYGKTSAIPDSVLFRSKLTLYIIVHIRRTNVNMTFWKIAYTLKWTLLTRDLYLIGPLTTANNSVTLETFQLSIVDMLLGCFQTLAYPNGVNTHTHTRAHTNTHTHTHTHLHDQRPATAIRV